MKKTRLIATALISSVLVMQVSVGAQPCGNGREGCDRGRDAGRDGNRHGPQAREHNPGERGAGPDHAFYRGDHLPMNYRSRQYVVDDWRGHGLHAPPRGYHWVQTGGDYVLAAVATGAILELLLNR